MSESEKELEAIANMVAAAERERLLIEVIWSFGQETASGIPFTQACVNALSEWDII